tara:strand:+ start:92 stop:523 length:432 start_codon:yes stop_codon:yes gene_type:complete
MFEMIVIIVLVIASYYLIFRNKKETVTSKISSTSIRDQEIIVHQTEMFLDVIYNGYYKIWVDSTDENLNQASNEISNLNNSFQKIWKEKFIGKSGNEVFPLDQQTFESIRKINHDCRVFFKNNLEKYYDKNFDQEFTPIVYKI